MKKRLKLKNCILNYLSLNHQFAPQISPQKRSTGSDSNTLLCSYSCPLKHQKTVIFISEPTLTLKTLYQGHKVETPKSATYKSCATLLAFCPFTSTNLSDALRESAIFLVHYNFCAKYG